MKPIVSKNIRYYTALKKGTSVTQISQPLAQAGKESGFLMLPISFLMQILVRSWLDSAPALSFKKETIYLVTSSHSLVQDCTLHRSKRQIFTEFHRWTPYS